MLDGEYGWRPPSRALGGQSAQADIATSAQGTALSVVYLDASKPAGTTSGSPRRTAPRSAPSAICSALAFERSTYAAACWPLPTATILSPSTLPAARRSTVSTPRLASAYIADNSTVFYATHPGCGPVEKTVIGRVNVSTGASHRHGDTDVPGSRSSGTTPTPDELTITPRGCDPGLGEIWTVNAKTGEQKPTFRRRLRLGRPLAGPQAGADLVRRSASAATTTRPELRAYALPGGTARAFTFDKDAPSHRPFVYSPDGKKAAFGLAMDRADMDAVQKSGGIWILDTAAMSDSKLWQDQGQESWAVDWSPDGSKLLVASREEENACTFSCRRGRGEGECSHPPRLAARRQKAQPGRLRHAQPESVSVTPSQRSGSRRWPVVADPSGQPWRCAAAARGWPAPGCAQRTTPAARAAG